MNATVFAFTLRGKATARRVAEALGAGCELLAPPRLAGEGFDGYAGSCLRLLLPVFWGFLSRATPTTSSATGSPI